jgi:hypothetical protein
MGAKDTQFEHCDSVCPPSNRLHGFLGAIVPERLPRLLVLPKRATAFFDRAKGLKEEDSGIVSSSVGTGSDS